MGKSKSQQKSASFALQRMPVGSPLGKLQTELEEKTRTLEALQQRLQEKDMEATEFKTQLEDKDAKLKKIDDIVESCSVQWCWLGPSGQCNYFSKEATLKVENAFKNNSGSGTMKVQSGVYTYEVDFGTMSQRNTDTGTIRNIRRQVLEYDTSRGLDDVILHGLQTAQAVQAQLDAVKEEASLAENRVQALADNLQDAQQGWEEDRTAKCRAKQEMAHAEEARKQAVENMEKMKAMLTEKEQEMLAMSRKYRIEIMSKSNLEAALTQAENIAKKAKEDQEAAEIANKQKSKADFDIMQKKHQDEMQRMSQAHHDKVSKMEEELRLMKSAAAKDAEEHCAKASESLNMVAALWREPKPFHYVLSQEPLSMHAQVCSVFKGLSHKAPAFQGALSRCHGFQSLKILSVELIHNSHLWKQYAKSRDELKERHRALGVDLQPLRFCFDGLNSLFPNHSLDSTVNEVILVHGCGEEASKAILEDGWDIRFTKSNNGGTLYGEGMYFGRQPCKCHQYTGQSNPRRMIISRVALGDPAYLQDEYSGRLPPVRDEANPNRGRHDSIVVSPDMSRRGQSHWEFVVFDGKQAYPEMLITYEV